MNLKKIKLLIKQSQTDSKLDSKKIAKIASMLKRDELKKYLILLKRQRMLEQVIVETSTPLEQPVLLLLKKRFKDKEIVVKIKQTLLGGIRLKMQDLIIDLSLEGQLLRLKNSLWQV